MTAPTPGQKAYTARRRAEAKADIERDLGPFVAAWRERHGATHVKCGDLARLIGELRLFPKVVGGGALTARSFRTAGLLENLVGKGADGVVVQRAAPQQQSRSMWRLVDVAARGRVVSRPAFGEVARSKLGWDGKAGDRIVHGHETSDGFALTVVEHVSTPEYWEHGKPFHGSVWCGVPHNHRSEDQVGDTFDEVVDLLVATKALWGYLLKQSVEGSVRFAQERLARAQSDLESSAARADLHRREVEDCKSRIAVAELRRDAVRELHRPTDGLAHFIERTEYEIAMLAPPHRHWDPKAAVWFEKVRKWALEIRDGDIGAHAPDDWRSRLSGG